MDRSWPFASTRSIDGWNRAVAAEPRPPSSVPWPTRAEWGPFDTARESLVRRVEGWLFAPGDPRRLAAVRIGLASVLAIRLSRGIFLKLAGQPRALYRPLSFMHL